MNKKAIFPVAFGNFRITIVILALFLSSMQSIYASHLLGAEMYYDCVGANQYRISLVLYRDCNGLSMGATKNVSINRCGTPSTQSLSLVSGYPQDVSALCPTSISNCSGGALDGIDKWLYQAVVTFPAGCNNIKISFSECCWSNMISSFTNPSAQNVFTEMIIDNTVSACNNSSRFLDGPNFSACNNQPFNYSFAVSDADADSLVYSLVNCRTSSGTAISYNIPFSGTNPLTTASGLSLDSRTGQLTFTPTSIQTSVLCVRVDEYRNGIKIAEQTRVSQIQVLNCSNTLPRLSPLNLAGTAQQSNFDYNFCVSNVPVCFDMIGYDANAADSVFVNWSNNIAGASLNVQRISNDSVRASFCFTPSSAGRKNFTVTVNDNACPRIGENTYTYNLIIGSPSLPISIQNAQTSCAGSADAVLNAVVTGGASPYTYSWNTSPVQTTSSATALASGQYCVTVVDNNGCSGVTCATVTSPNVSVAISVQNQVSCFGGSDASLTANAQGASPFVYVWSTGSVSQNQNGLGIGQYCVTISDNNGCTATNCITVTQPSQISVTLNTQQMTCALNNAAITLSVNGGVSPYTFQWTGPNSFSSNLSNLNALIAGTYLLNVVDANGCVANATSVVDSFTRSYFNQYLLVSEDSTLDITVNLPSNPLSQITVQTPSAGSLVYQSGGDYVYTPQIPAQVFDTIIVRHCNGTDAFDTEIIVAIASCVWAGDCDTNQLVNNFDLLPIGLNYGSADNPRPNAGTDWDCEPMTDWAPFTGQANPKHADTNGDGFIDVNDTLAISNNWGSFYLRSLTNSNGAAPLYLDTATVAPGDTVRLDVLLGNALQNATNVYGIAFTVNYDNSIVDTNSVRMKYDNSWLGTKDLDMLAMSKDFYPQSRTEVALVRTDHTGRSNSGAIAHIQFTIKDDVLKSTNLRLNLSISNVRMIDSAAVELPVSPLPSSVLILPAPTSVNSFEKDNEVIIFPNPATDLITVSSLYPIDDMKIISIDSKEIQLDKSQNTINVSTLSPGLYCLLIESKGKQIIKKFVKK
jgi:hypothetical protein